MSDPSGQPDTDSDDSLRSRFTRRDLRLLGQSSVASPLRVIALVDFDCFYAQCEGVRLGLPDSQPLGVQQFKHVIAINYAARAAGLKKVVTAVEAKEKCPDIVLQHVPTWREGDTTWAYRDDVHQFMDRDKSSLDYYRLQSRKAMEVIKRVLPAHQPQRIEKAGIDEAFVDLSAQVYGMLVKRYPELSTMICDDDLDSALPRPPSEVLEWDNDLVVGTEESGEELRIPDWDDVALLLGSEVIRELRLQIRQQLGYTCSAGIARNKVLAKLAAGHNKPNKQTVVRSSCIPFFLSQYKFTKIRGLGGKLGDKVVEKFKTDMVVDLLPISLKRMQSDLGSESGRWVYRVIRGFEDGEVASRTQVQSMFSAKTFTPSINGLGQAEKWLHIFAADIMGRMADQEGRRPRTIAVHHQINGRFGPTKSKQASIPLGSKLDMACLLALSRNLLVDITREGPSWPCLTLSVGVSDFFDTDTTSRSITSFLHPGGGVPVGKSRAVSDNVPLNADHPQEEEEEEEEKEQEARRRTKKRTLLDYQSDPFRLGADRAEKRHALSTTIGSSSSSNSSSRRPPQEARNVDLLDHPSSKTKTDTDTNTDTDGGGMPTTEEEEEEEKEEAGTYPCPACRRSIAAAHVLEHLDWHVALSLQNQR